MFDSLSKIWAIVVIYKKQLSMQTHRHQFMFDNLLKIYCQLSLSYSKDYNSTYPTNSLQRRRTKAKTGPESLRHSAEDGSGSLLNLHLISQLLSCVFHLRSCIICAHNSAKVPSSFHDGREPVKYYNLSKQI